MNKRIVIEEATALQVASLAQPRVLKVTKPQGDQSIVLDLNDQSVKLDFSAIANEKMTLVQVGTKLVILFDNLSTVTADPFFDYSGKPFSELDVELGAGRAVNGEQFAQLFPITVAQSVLPDDDKILPSGAHFADPFIDPLFDGSIGPLPHGSSPLAQFGERQQGPNLFAEVGGVAPSQQIFSAPTPAFAGSGAPVVSIPPPGVATTLVLEAGLGPRGSEPAGSQAGKVAITTQPGLINFTSADGVQSVSLGGHPLTTSSQTFADGTTGSLTAFYTFDPTTHQGAIHYTYTLLDNTLGIPSTSFAVAITDPNSDSAGGNLVITIKDDAPVAKQDVDILGGAQAAETGNVLTGAGTASALDGADVQGADGGVTVVGVAAGIGPGGANPATVGVAIAGAFGTLTLNADGSYSYVHGTGGSSDVFTYTIRDADGSPSSATLTIVIGDSAPGNIVIPPSDTPGQTQVFEAGLLASRGAGESAGSNPAAPTTSSGTITFTSPDGVSKVQLGNLELTTAGVSQSVSDATGSLTASFTFNAVTGQGAIHYIYTLLDNTLTDPSSVSFAVAVIDIDTDRTVASNNLVITIKDDAPAAVADTDSVAAGQLTAETGNVLTGVNTTSNVADVQGADGAVVAGVAVGNTGADLVNAGTVGVALTGAFGTLILNADGSYSYAHNGSPGGGTDVFTYTIRDADGDVSHTALTITVADSSPGNIVVPAVGSGDTTVFEGGLPARSGEPAGSDPALPATTSGMITFSSPDGVGSVELGGHVVTATSAQTAQQFADGTRGLLTAWFSYDTTIGGGAIHYTYTLLDNTDARVTSSIGFTVAVVDLDGDRTPGSDLVISIVDDAPIARPDVDVVVAGQTTAETGNVLDGSGTSGGQNGSGADIQGADGATVVGIALGSGATVGPTLAVGAAGATQITGLHGTLTIHADGSYSYLRNGAGGVADTFTYTIQDSDGSQSSSAALTIAIGDSLPGNIVIPATGGADTTVFEAGLGPRGSEPAGSHAGDPAFPTTTQNGTVTFTSPDGVSKIELGGLTLTTAGTPGTLSDATGTLTASFTFNAATGQGAIHYTYTLLDNTLGVPSANFAVEVTDNDGDTASGNLVITITDDAPAAVADTDSVAAGQLTAETGNVVTGVGTTSNVADVQGADGVVVAGVAVGNTGIDLVSAGTVGTAIAGTLGTLTLNADGSYSYVRNAGAPGGGSDAFTYTIRDADGSLSHTTLTISLAGSSGPGNIVIPPPGVAGAGTQVDEAGLPARTIGGVNEPAGSNAASTSETTTGAITFSSPAGVSKIELGGLTLTTAGTPGTLSDATGTLTASYTFDAVSHQGTINYSYTLIDNTSGDATSASFAVAVTDTANQRTVAGSNLIIAIHDDVPTALADTDAVAAGQTTPETGNVLTGVGTTSNVADVQGADGVVVAGVAVGNTGIDLVSAGTVGTAIAGTLGTLTLNADGSYSYVRNAGAPGGGSDAFTYTIRDADGSLSHTTLTIAVADSSPGGIVIPSAGGATTQVFEAGLLAARGPGESAGSHAGETAFPTTTQAGTITFTSPEGQERLRGRATV